MSEYIKNVLSRDQLAVKVLYGAAAFLLVSVLVYAGVIAVVSGTVESSQDRVGIHASIPVAISIAVVAAALAIAAFLISRPSGRNETTRP